MNRLDHLNPTPQRPLGELSNYTVTGLKRDIVAFQEAKIDIITFVQKIEQLAGDVLKNSILISAQDQNFSLGLFDVAMLASAIIALNGSVGPNLTVLIEALAIPAQSIAGLTYEGLIHANPLQDDPRTFLSGKGADAELLFYKKHAEIEALLVKGTEKLEEILLSFVSPLYQLHQLAPDIQFLKDLIQSITQHMQVLIRELSPADFSAMRPFFTNRKGLHGPSGKYSAGMFVFDALCFGSDPAIQPLLTKKLAEKAYYPTTTLKLHGFVGQDDMQQSFDSSGRGNNLKAYVTQSNQPFLRQLFTNLAESIAQLRAMHTGLILKFIPDARGHAIGTAGDPIQQHIKTIKEAYKSACQLPPLVLF